MGREAAVHHRTLGALAAERGVSDLFAYGAHACDIIAGARDAGISRADFPAGDRFLIF